MPFEYGSQQVDIPNPFKLEGAAYTARAAVLIALGVVALLGVRPLVADGERAVAAVVMFGGLGLAGFGVFAAYRGLYKMFRFYVGRGQPADLAATVAAEQTVMPGAPSGGATGYRGIYQPVELANMLLGRKNPTFREPEGWLPRLLHSLISNLIFLPYALRNDAGSRFAAAAHSVVILALLGLAWFAGVTGLVPMAGTPVMAWLVAIITLLLVSIWLREALRPSGGNRTAILRFTPLALVIWAAIAVATPFALVAVNGVQAVARAAVLTLPVVHADIALGRRGGRVQLVLGDPPRAAHAARDQRQRVPRALAGIGASDGYLPRHRDYVGEAPFPGDPEPRLRQRCAAARGPGLAEQRRVRGAHRAGSPAAADRGSPRDLVLQVGIAAGQVLMLGAGITLFALLMDLATITASGLVQALLAAVILWMAGKLIAQTSTLYVSEIEFESDLIVFQATGTFAESRLATGMSIYDSTRSENVIVRSSLTPWLIVSRLHTSTLTVSGSANLEQPRLILGMNDNPTLSRDLVADARAFLKDRQIMASVNSESDLQAAANIYQMNEHTRANTNARQGQSVVTQETRDDKLLTADDPAEPTPG